VKVHHYDQMMAYLTRQRFANGGGSILPKPNPLSSEERNQKVFNDYVGRMKKYLADGVGMPEWFVKDLVTKKAEELGVELKADGGRMGFNKGKSEALIARQKADEAIKKVIDAKKSINLKEISRLIDVPESTVGRVYHENYKDLGTLGKSPDSTKVLNEIIESGITDIDEIKKIAKDTHNTNIADRTIKAAVNIATDLSVAEYEQIFRKMAADRTYQPPVDISAKGKGLTANYNEAKANVKKEIPKIQELINQNISKRKKIKYYKKIHSDPESKTKYLASKQMARDKKRFLEEGQIGLSDADKTLNYKQRILLKGANDLINSNPEALLNDKTLLEKISWRIDSDGNLYQSNPDLTEVINPTSNSRFFHLSHGRRAQLKTQLTDAPVNRFVAPFSMNNEFIKDAETFIEKNPKHPKVRKILEKAKELKITLRPDVELGTFKNAKGNPVRYVGYTENINDPIGKIETVINEYTPKGLKSKWSGMVSKSKNWMNTLKFKAGKLDLGTTYKKFRPWIEKGVDLFPGKIDNAAAAVIDYPMMMMAGAPEALALASAASMLVKEPNVGKVANVAIDMAQLSDEDKWAARSAERKDKGMTYLDNIKHMANQEKVGENLEAAERLKIIQSTAQDIEPFKLDEKEEVVTENKPIYGPYADQIKNLKIS